MRKSGSQNDHNSPLQSREDCLVRLTRNVRHCNRGGPIIPNEFKSSTYWITGSQRPCSWNFLCPPRQKPWLKQTNFYKFPRQCPFLDPQALSGRHPLACTITAIDKWLESVKFDKFMHGWNDSDPRKVPIIWLHCYPSKWNNWGPDLHQCTNLLARAYRWGPIHFEKLLLVARIQFPYDRPRQIYQKVYFQVSCFTG